MGLWEGVSIYFNMKKNIPYDIDTDYYKNTIEYFKSTRNIGFGDNYDNTIECITELEDLIEEKSGRDIALVLLDGGVLDKWLRLSALVYMLRPICSKNYRNMVNIQGTFPIRKSLMLYDMLLDVVRAHELLTRINKLRRRYSVLAENTAKAYSACSTRHKEGKYGLCFSAVYNYICYDSEEIDEEDDDIEDNYLLYFNKFNDRLEDMHCDIKNMIYEMQGNVGDISYLTAGKLESICPQPAEYKQLMEDGLRDYSRANGPAYMEQLERTAIRFKQRRSDSLSVEVWGKLMKEEDDFLESLADGELPTIDTDKGEALGYSHFAELKANARLIRAVLDASKDEKVFDLECASKEPFNLFSAITPENLYLFMKLVLRRNLIQCQMFPHMKEAYELWLSRVNAEEVDGNKDNCTSQPELEFDKNAVLTYVSKIKEADEETNEKMKTFWSSLVERWAELTTIRYNKSESCFKRGRSEDKNVNFSKKFVCCVIGYLINTDKYHLTNTKICEMLGENSDNGSARLKNMQDCLKDYDNKVEKVVKEVIKEVFG